MQKRERNWGLEKRRWGEVVGSSEEIRCLVSSSNWSLSLMMRLNFRKLMS